MGLGAICSSLDALGIPDEFVALEPEHRAGARLLSGPVFEALLIDALEFRLGGRKAEGTTGLSPGSSAGISRQSVPPSALIAFLRR